MQNRILASETPEKVGQNVTLYGWIERVRSHGKIAFFDLKDRTGVLQVVAASPETVASIEGVSPQSVVKIEGLVKERGERYINPDIPLGKVEVELTSAIELVSKAHELPFDMGGVELNLQLPTLLDYRTLTLRNKKIADIFKVQASILKGFRNSAEELGCIEIVVPEIAASATEGGAEVFKVDYYGHSAFMTQSPQLYKQMLVPTFERVYTVAHAYRAEPSVTTSHLSVATQMDCEFGFVEFDELLDLLERVGTKTLLFAESQNEDILKEHEVERIQVGTIPRLTLRKAQEIIFEETGRDVRSEKDLSRQDEIDICNWARNNHASDFVTITHFPTKKRAFYTKPDPTNPEYSLSYDMLFRGVEIMSGSQRISDYEELMDAIKDRDMDPANFEMYLQAFKFGMPPEGGFSFGLERMTMHMLNLSNVREASLFPRDMERIDERLSIKAKKEQ